MLGALVSVAVPLALAAPEDPESELWMQERIQALEEQTARDRALLLQYEARLAAMEHAAQPQLPPIPPPLAEPLIIEPDEITGEIVAWGPVSVHGKVHGRAVSFGGDVRVFDGAQVTGDAVSFGGQVRVDPGADVQGDRISYAATTAPPPGPPLAPLRRQTRGLARQLVLLFTMAGGGVVMTGLFPKPVERVSDALRRHPFRYFGWGLLSAFLASVLGTILAVTVIGIPVAMLLGLLMAVAWVMGSVAICQLIGDSLPFQATREKPWVGFLAGAALLGALSLLPGVGKAVLTILGLTGMGAAIRSRLGSKDIVPPLD
ncbi:MAG: hypothetical protein VX899_21545 [Myxococcota bacterium]|nr:hypothetical protein [Myxococcota bacterium]